MSDLSAAHSFAPARLRVRWKIFALLCAFGMVAYLQQRSLTIAAYKIMPELHLSQMQLGWLETAFLLGYALLQFPGGVLGQRLGARRTLILIGVLGFACTVATPFEPLLLAGTALFAMLLATQLLLGASQGPIFPVTAGVIESWFLPRTWPLAQGLMSMTLGLVSALTPPLITHLMSAFDWQRALLWTAVPAVALVVVWRWYGRNTPSEHPSVSAQELAELGEHVGARADNRVSWRDLWRLVRNRDVGALTVSYLCMNYVFYLLANWSFLYLVQERHFTMLEGGWLAGAPPIAAAIGAGVGGKLASDLCVRLGVRRGLRAVPLVSMPVAGLLLLYAVHAANGYLAVLALSLCYLAIELNEGPYWAAAMEVARGESMAATGLLNTGGNVAGFLGTPIVAYFSGQHAWQVPFVLGAVLALVSAALWLLVDPLRRVSSRPGDA
ncbi:MAG TPA: MFS transporter [Steroidobacteraceae bacterium]|nr:MFS transporter [Steroidobacteraceae bacterium]